MNSRQRNVLKVALAVLVGMFLFPPFHEPVAQGVMGNSGFSFILSPPESHFSFTPSVNAIQLVAQWLGVVIIGAVAYVLAQGPEHATIEQRTEKVPALREAFQRSKPWLWIALAFSLMPFLWVSDTKVLAIKVIGNAGAAILVYAAVFVWNWVRVKRGLEANAPNYDKKTSLKRVAVGTALGAVAVTAFVVWTIGSRDARQPSESTLSPLKPNTNSHFVPDLRIGVLESGYRFKGGDPSKPDSWEPASAYLTDEEVFGTKGKSEKDADKFLHSGARPRPWEQVWEVETDKSRAAGSQAVDWSNFEPVKGKGH